MKCPENRLLKTLQPKVQTLFYREACLRDEPIHIQYVFYGLRVLNLLVVVCFCIDICRTKEVNMDEAGGYLRL